MYRVFSVKEIEFLEAALRDCPPGGKVGLIAYNKNGKLVRVEYPRDEFERRLNALKAKQGYKNPPVQ